MLEPGQLLSRLAARRYSCPVTYWTLKLSIIHNLQQMPFPPRREIIYYARTSLSKAIQTCALIAARRFERLVAG